MSMNVGGSRDMSAEMNVTPLIDVLLVLIIIFMIITPLTPHGEEARLPQPAEKHEAGPPPPSTVVLQVMQDVEFGVRVKINEESVEWKDLRARLVDIYKLRAEKIIFVKADNALDWQKVAEAICEARLAGVDQVALMTDERNPEMRLMASR